MTATLSLVLSTSGGRFGARRSLRRVLAAVLVAGAAAGATAAAQEAPPAIAVHEHSGVYEVVATFAVARPPQRVLAVLSDYEGIPKLLPDVKRSVVRTRDGDRAVVEQEAVSRVLFFSKTVHLRLDIQEGPDAIAFRDVCGSSFTLYEGRWDLTPSASRTTIVYRLRAKPAFDVPEFLVKRLMKRDAGQMVERLRKAMLD